MKESFQSPAPGPTLSFGEQCKWDVDERSEHQLVSLGCLKLQLWASGISPERDQHKTAFSSAASLSRLHWELAGTLQLLL